jgi:ketol-acid reductoisomerase
MAKSRPEPTYERGRCYRYRYRAGKGVSVLVDYHVDRSGEHRHKAFSLS